MAPRKTVKASVASVATAAPEAPYGELSGRLRELFAKTVKPGPYPVSDTILIKPPTKAAWQQLDVLQNQKMAGQFTLAAAAARTGENAPTIENLAEISQFINNADEQYSRLFFGDQYDNVIALSADWEPADWNAFCDDAKAYFLGRGPDTGSCPHCGNTIDEVQAGKEPTPST